MSALATPARAPRRGLLGEFGRSVSTMMVKELRSRFRGRRAFVVLTLYLAVLALIAYGAYSVVAPGARSQAEFNGFTTGGNPNASAEVGQAIFAMLSVIQLLLVSFIAPALTAGAISLEREKQTLDLLIATPLRPGAIVVGKLLSALAFVVLMILAGIPVSALVLMYGGVTIDDILRQQVVLFASAIGLGVIGLFISALLKRTQAAIVLTYCVLLALTIGTLLVWRFWTGLLTNSPDNLTGGVRTAPDELLYGNPAVAMIEVVANTEVTFGDFSEIMSYLLTGVELNCEGGQCFPTTPTLPFREGVINLDALTLGRQMWRQSLWVDVVTGEVAQEAGALEPAVDLGLKRGALGVGPPGEIDEATVGVPQAQALSNHFWPRFTLSFGLMSVILTLASMRLVVPAGMRFGFRRRRSETAAAASAEGASAIEETLP
jgi:ABC-type transport system involved in multi-copper enzyme maturation permease subunit